MTDQTLEYTDILGDLRAALHLRHARRRRRGLVAAALVAAVAVTGVALGGSYSDWWRGGAAPVHPRVVERQIHADQWPAGLGPISGRARTVASVPGAALVAAPTPAGGYCLIPSLAGKADLGFYCENGPGAGSVVDSRSGAGGPALVYGRILNPRAFSVDLGAAGGRVRLERGGFFLAAVPGESWSSLSGTRSDVVVRSESGSVLSTSCVGWSDGNGDSPNEVDGRPSCADEPPAASAEFSPVVEHPVLPVAAPGKPGFAIVWQSSCSPCEKALRDLQSFAATHPGVPVIGLDAQDLPQPAAATLARLGVEFPSSPIDGTAVGDLALDGYPTVLAFDAGGRVVATAEGDVFAATLEAELARLR